MTVIDLQGMPVAEVLGTLKKQNVKLAKKLTYWKRRCRQEQAKNILLSEKLVELYSRNGRKVELY